ncbi:hypothetical protein [Methyloceanibacter caenitepidi]|uniref:hypothetical protein n=1 Tax=Methyloceanibacter caenitepidi TaxID=1384459 RepID=UPI0005ED646F|nr:hypothetical protein [Methyloceanibacter caenitepidi]
MQQPKRDFVEVRWLDIKGSAEWHAVSELPTPARCVTRGWVIREDKRDLTLAASLIEPEPGEDESVGDVTVIPKGCITSRKKLRTVWTTR